MATNVPQPTFTPTGLVIPSTEAVFAGVCADINAAFGGDLNFALTTPQGQLASSLAAIISNVYQTFAYYVNQVDPAFATGRMQDAIGRFNDIERLPAEPTVLQVVCVGAVGTALPAGPSFATVVDDSNNLYQLQEAATIPVGGSITLPFACSLPGPVAVPETVSIYMAIPGWDTATVSSGVVGQDVESRAAFEARRQASIAKNSIGALDSVLGAVLAVSGVLEAYVTENPTASNATIGGVSLVPNSIYVAAVGGAAADVARAIWSKKSPGCAYNGNTTVTVQDTSPGYNPPLPSYQVSFEIPDALQILFDVVLLNNGQVPSNATALVQAAIQNAFAGGDGGPRATIGSTILASRFIAPILALGTWAQVVSLTIGSPNTPASSFRASIAATTMTVVSVASGVLAADQTITGGDVINGTRIVSQITGTPGGTGTYTLNVSQTLGATDLLGSNADRTSVDVRIDQTPTLDDHDIVVTVS